MPNKNLKEAAYQFCKKFAEMRLARIQTNIRDLQESLTSETKSSAGDKHETGRAMLQLEREKLGEQLAEAEKTKRILSKVELGAKTDKIGLGSLVYSSKANYYIAISAGEYKEGKTSIFCISSSTPMGQILIGRSNGDSVIFGKEEIHIEKIE